MCLEKRNKHATVEGGQWETQGTFTFCHVGTLYKAHVLLLQSAIWIVKKYIFFFFRNIHQIVVDAATLGGRYLKSLM